MFKKLFVILSLLLSLAFVWAQGVETFANSGLTATYSDGSFIGDEGFTWEYGHSRDEGDYPITGNGLMLRRASDSYLQATIPGGVGSFSFEYRKAFTGSSARQLEVYVDGVVMGTSPSFGTSSVEETTVYVMTVVIDTEDDVEIKIKNVGTTTGNRQTVIDNISWTAPGNVPPPTPTINVSGSLTAFSTEVGSPSLAQTYSLSGSALTANISVAAPTGFEISSDGSSYGGSLSLSSSYNGSVYVRLIGDEVGSYSGNITHSSTGASQVDLAVSGTVSEPVEPEDPVVLFVENFIYDADMDLLGNTSWAQTGDIATNPIQVVEGNLSYTGYLQNEGNMVHLTTSGQDVHHLFQAQESGSVYTAVLINVESAKSGGDYFLHYGTSPMGSAFAGRVFLKKDGDNDSAFLGLVYSSGAGAVTQYTTTSYPFGSTILLVLKYSIVDGEKNDVTSLFINPVPGAPEPTPNLVSASGYTGAPADLASVASIGLRQGSASNAAALDIDGIRVTNDWALLWSEDVPEPCFIHVSGEPDPLANIAGTPSEEISHYNLSGENLIGPITITAPTGFEVSDDEEQGWGNPIQVPATFDDKIYVRLVSSELGEHAGFIVHTNPWADAVSIRVEGETFSPDVTFNIVASLDAFEQTIGSPSAVQSYSLSATGAQNDIEVNVESPFELSESGTGNWTDELTLPNNFNGTIYVRMNATVADEFSKNIVHSTPGASPENLPVNGRAIPPAGDQYATDLFISEYIEGSNYNKSIEIFNGTGATVNLGNYTLKKGQDGGNWNANKTLSGTLDHGAVYVISHASANADILAATDLIDSNVINFNGDDAVGLFKGDILIDIIGLIDGIDPGNGWPVAGIANATQDHTLIRKPYVTEGNTDWELSAGTDEEDSEWIVMSNNYTDDIGSHTFAPGDVEVVARPVISPDGGLYFAPVSVTIQCDTPDAAIYYTTDGNTPSDTNGTLYQGYFTVSENTTVKAIAYAVDMEPSPIALQVYSFPIDVQNIAELRSKTPGTGDVYRLVGEAVLTYQNNFRNTKYIQDATAAIVIDDDDGHITSSYNLYDGITGITGTLNLYNQLLQFVPSDGADPGAATSPNNVVIPEVRTLASLTSADQAKLIKVMNVDVDDTVFQSYPATAQNINVSDPSGTSILRTFYNTDYAETPVHDYPVNITGVAGQFGNDMQISPRFLTDFEAYTGGLEAPVVTITKDGNNIKLNWNAVAGATAYDIYGSNDPYTGYSLLQANWTGTEWTHATANMKFYYVKAKN